MGLLQRRTFCHAPLDDDGALDAVPSWGHRATNDDDGSTTRHGYATGKGADAWVPMAWVLLRANDDVPVATATTNAGWRRRRSGPVYTSNAAETATRKQRSTWLWILRHERAVATVRRQRELGGLLRRQRRLAQVWTGHSHPKGAQSQLQGTGEAGARHSDEKDA